MQNTFHNTVLTKGAFLIDDFGFKIFNNSDDEIIIMESDDIRFRFVMDRNDYYLDISSIKSPNYCYDFNDVIDYITATKKSARLKPAVKLKSILSRLKTYYKDISIIFSFPNFNSIKDLIRKSKC